MKYEKFYVDSIIKHAEKCVEECITWQDAEPTKNVISSEACGLTKRAIAIDIQSLIGAPNSIIDYEALNKLNTLYASVEIIEKLYHQ